MKIVTKSQAVQFSNADTCHGLEASFEGAPMDGSLITIKGRYPEAGYVMNEVCKELAFVVRGNGNVCTLESTVAFSEHDTVYLDSGETYYWEGDFDIYTVCTPAFYPEQHKEVQ